MNYEVLVGVGDCGANLAKDSQPLFDSRMFVIAILRNSFAFHIFHSNERQTICSGATVQQTCDVWMIERSQHITLHHEAAHNRFGVHFPFDDFESYPLMK